MLEYVEIANELIDGLEKKYLEFLKETGKEDTPIVHAAFYYQVREMIEEEPYEDPTLQSYVNLRLTLKTVMFRNQAMVEALTNR